MKELRIIAKDALGMITSAGAQKGVAVAVTAETHEFNVDGGKFSLFRTLFDNSLRLTAYKDDKKGTVVINSFEDDAVKKAVADTIASAESGAPDPAWDIAPKTENRTFTSGVIVPDLDKFFFRTKELLETINKEYPKIIMEQMIVTHKTAKSVYLNSNGAEYEENEGYYSVSLMYSAHDGDKCTSFFGSDVTTTSLDKPFIEYASMRKDLADVESQLDTINVQGKFTGTLLVQPGCMGDVIGTALSNFASDMPILDGTSIWREKLGEKVASDCLTVSMAPHNENIVCGENITADGFIAEDYDVIKDGKLNRFMLSLYVANKTGLDRAPNSSGAMVVKAGETPLDEIIAGIEHGIILGRFSGGQPSSNGDFSGVAKNSFLIENGKIKGALSETMISGNLADVLMNVKAISKETVADGSCVFPYIAFDGVVVSGAEK